MQVIIAILKCLMLLLGALCAVSCASVGNFIGLTASVLVIGLILPYSLIKCTKHIAAIFLVALLWHVLHTYFITNLERVFWGEVAFIILLSECIFLAYYQSGKFRMLLWGCLCLVMLHLAIIAWVRGSVSQQQRVAFLERGQWGISHTNELAYNVNSQYSYTLIKKMFSAESISSLERVEDFDSLWVITPTKPFSTEEIQSIERWVRGGGTLNVVSDHTDLFGHASVLNKLLRVYGITSGKDCIIGDHPEDSPYWSVVGWFYGMTANSINGDCWPFLLQFGYNERTDYNGRSFFSDGAVTDEDRWGVYCVGARKSYGRGMVLIFADSTMFADFALSRPSSQFVLRMMRDNLFAINLPAVLLLLCLTMFCLELTGVRDRKWAMWVVTTLAVLLIISYWMYIGYSSIVALEKPLENGKRGLPTCGNWDLVDVPGREYDVLFAANFASQVPMPEWRMIPNHHGNITCNGIQLPRLGTLAALAKKSELERVIATPPSITFRQYLDSLTTGSTKDGFWFEAGIGLCKETAYKNFWRSLLNVEEELLEIGAPKRMKASYVLDGKHFPAREMYVSDITDVKDWLIVGDWLLGKKLKDCILIRDRWQDGGRRYGDIIIYPEDQGAIEH